MPSCMRIGIGMTSWKSGRWGTHTKATSSTAHTYTPGSSANVSRSSRSCPSSLSHRNLHETSIHHAFSPISHSSGTKSILLRYGYTRLSPPLSPSTASPIRFSPSPHAPPSGRASDLAQSSPACPNRAATARQRFHPQTLLCPSPVHTSRQGRQQCGPCR